MDPTNTSVKRASAGLFTTTHWSVIRAAKDNAPEALQKLCATYRPPLLVWLKQRGHSPEDAEDCAQGLFEHLLSSDFLRNVAREKGRFRTFMLAALKNHLADLSRKARAEKRGGGYTPESLDEVGEDGEQVRHSAGNDLAPDRAYDQAWAKALLASALGRLERECARTGHKSLCEALEPTLYGDSEAPTYAQIGERLGMSEAAVKTAAHRIRQRLKGIVRDEVAQTVADEHDLNSELAYLQSLFAKPAKGAV